LPTVRLLWNALRSVDCDLPIAVVAPAKAISAEGTTLSRIINITAEAAHVNMPIVPTKKKSCAQ